MSSIGISITQTFVDISVNFAPSGRECNASFCFHEFSSARTFI